MGLLFASPETCARIYGILERLLPEFVEQRIKRRNPTPKASRRGSAQLFAQALNDEGERLGERFRGLAAALKEAGY